MNKADTFSLQDAARRLGPRAFSTLVKPGGSACNLACGYCYYLEKAGLYGGREPVMSEELLETYIRQFIDAVQTGPVDFCWHGGEPLLLGTGFFKKALELQRKYAGGREIRNSLETNGTLLTDEWCRFFARNQFLVGLSFDGPEDIHDAYRVNKGGRASFGRVMEAAAMLRRHGVEFNTLSVLTTRSEGRGAEIYRFFRDNVGSRYMQFLPASDTLPDGSPAPWNISPKGYGQLLCDIFDEWSAGDIGRCFVLSFDAAVAGWCGLKPGICTFNETCGDSLAVEHNGDVYPCDHFVAPENLLGNITRTPLGDIYDSPERLRFALAKRNTLPGECLKCRYLRACRGGCPAQRGPDGRNRLCEGLRAFFRHIEPFMDEMRASIL